MLNGLYGYLFGSEDANNNTKENAAVLTNSAELIASASPDGTLKNKDDDWVVVEREASGRSTPVLVPEPYLIAIDDELLLAAQSSRSESPTLASNRYDCAFGIGQGQRPDIFIDGIGQGQRRDIFMKRIERIDRVRQAKQKSFEKKELERQLFEDQVLRSGSEANKKQTNNCSFKIPNMQNNATKMKRSTAAGHFATESKTKPRSKKTNRLQAGRNNDRKVNNLN